MFPKVEKITAMEVSRGNKPLGLKMGYKYGKIVFVPSKDGQDVIIYDYDPNGIWDEGA